jgi:neutral amino acid transport system permease protein
VPAAEETALVRSTARALLLAVSVLLALLTVGAPALAIGSALGPLAQEADEADEAEDAEDAEEADDAEDADEADDADVGEDEEEVGPGVLFGTLRGDDGPVEGAVLVVTDDAGNEVGEAISGETGRWELEVGEGDFTVTVDSLPEGVELRDPEQDSVEASVGMGDRSAVSIRLGAPPETRGVWASLAQHLVSGLRFGLLIAMTAIGLSLVFGTTGLINFAHGEIVIIGAFLAWSLNAVGPTWPLLVAAPIAVVGTAAFGGLIDRGMFRPLRRRGVGLFQLLVVTIGLSLVLRYGLLMIYGGSRRQYTDFIGQEALRFGPISMTPRNLIIMGISVVVLTAVGLLLMKSRMGKAMRAVADNRDLAESSGIDVEKVVGRVWIYGSGLAGLGGILYGSMFSFQYIGGFQLLLLMFAAVILGGLGTAFGAMVGGILIGIVVEVSAVFFPPDLGWAWALGILILALLLRPQGLLGRRERVG